MTLTGNLEIQLKLLGSSNKKKTEDEDLINIFIIIIEIPILGSSEFIDVALPHVSVCSQFFLKIINKTVKIIVNQIIILDM